MPFISAKALSATEWNVVDAYANFSTAVLAVYSTRSVALLARDLATGTDPEALYTRATVESVAIRGCQAKLNLELYYPGGRSLHYVSSWVRPFDRATLAHAHAKHQVPGRASPPGTSLAALAATQYAPWQFVGDNRVGGVDTPCGI